MSKDRNRLFGLGVIVLSIAVVGTAAYGFVVKSDAAEEAKKQMTKVAVAGARTAATVAASAAVAVDVASSCAAACGHGSSSIAAAAGPIDLAALGGICASGSKPSTASGGAACAVAPSATAFHAPGGKLTGNFETAVSAACQGACAARIDFEPADVVQQPGAVVGNLAQCPVSGVVFKVRANSATSVHDGDTYYTCCGSCAGILSAKPSQFLKS